MDDHDQQDKPTYKADDADNEIPEPQENQRRRAIALIIIILLLLLLVWPVNKPATKKQGGSKSAPSRSKRGTVGNTNYRVLNAAALEIPGLSRKVAAIKVVLTIENLYPDERVVDYSLLKIKDEHGNEYPLNQVLTQKWHDQNNRTSPWDQEIGAGKARRVTAFFTPLRSPPKRFDLLVKDLDWQQQKFSAIDLGTFNNIGYNF